MKIEIDGHKLMYHPERVAEWNAKGDCFPIYVEIGPTNRCNHHCMFCALDWLKHGGSDINSQVLCANLEDMASCGVKSIMFAGEGEPFLHKAMPLFLQTAGKNGINSSMTSNAVPFTLEKAEQSIPYLSWMRFSVDAGTPKSYAQLHGTKAEDFEKAMKNIGEAVKIRNAGHYNSTIGVQALLTNISLNELEMLAKRLKDMGVDNLQIKPYSHHPSSKNDLSFDYTEAEKIRPKLEAISDKNFQIVYRTNTIARLQQDREYCECYGLPFFGLIDSRGEVIPCNLFYNQPEFSYGNINEQKFSEIWKGERRKQVIGKIKKAGIEDCRKGCRLDAINRYLHRLKNPHPHDKFI